MEKVRRHFTPGAGQGGPQEARGIQFPGDEMGVPSDEKGSRPFRRFGQQRTRKEQAPKAGVYFLQGTTIFPINPMNHRPRGGRTLQETLYANRVYGKKNEPEKVNGLSLWKAASKAKTWNGRSGKRFIIRPNDQFTAYVINAKAQK